MTTSRRVLVVGSGGREHALAWKLSLDGADVLVAPGNAGTAQVAENIAIQPTDTESLLKIAKEREVDLTIVGPEAPLVAGIVDAFKKEGQRIFGPTAQAAQLEGSKVFCKQILHRGDVPTAMYQAFDSPPDAIEFLNAREDVPVVVKADGLAAGKGVFVCDSREEAITAIETLKSDPQFKEATSEILIEERLDGMEVSVMAITDGRTIVTMPPLQDHKAAHDGDTGPNTGGMGAYCPTPFVNSELMQQIEESILVPTIHSLRRSKVPFQGVLYAGLMLTNQGPKVLEYNARFGDPECQALMMRLESSVLELFDAAVDRQLEKVSTPIWRDDASVTVVMASSGYPGKVEKGHLIHGLNEASSEDNVVVFHAATRETPNGIVNDGGRVLSITGLGDTIAKAKLHAYSAVKKIRWQGAWCRKDISDKAFSLPHGELATRPASLREHTEDHG